MALTRRVELVPLERTASGNALFSLAQPSDETLIADLAPHQPASIFCHRRQTDQLILLRGSLELVVLEDGRLLRIPLREDEPMLVRIPPGVPHGAINTSRHYATVVNAVLRHGPPDPRDYKPRPLPHSLRAQWQELMGEPAPAGPPRPADADDRPSHSAPGRG
ncbi:cupin domain-containing protein [Synechococcus sp. CS-1329]|uniref:cupin domain-containing protein n=1 Tax=Synechococcus sp. CS-1329 TaxID=2847975 RepID=UPI00223C13BA|nr:cupin domain-containing protein [Synechococcus sp. CS-1329]MCT0218648.1 cupin domain-containing protein [Synechococcus sp. CS-1329]